MTLTWKQKQILEYCRRNGQMTKIEAVAIVRAHYENPINQTEIILDRLVRNGHLIESAPGLFKAGTGKKSPPVDAGQTELF